LPTLALCNHVVGDVTDGMNAAAEGGDTELEPECDDKGSADVLLERLLRAACNCPL